MNDQSLADSTADSPPPSGAGSTDGRRTPPPALSQAAVETVLSLDELMSSARLVERTARICLRADLEADYETALEELGSLVDEHGTPLTKGEQALTDGNRAQELVEAVEQLRTRMRESTRVVRFRAMPSDEWEAFEKSHMGADDKVKDVTGFNEQIIARCAINPTMTVQQVRDLRGKLGPTQYAALANAAYWACTTGGVDVPKSPSFSPAPKPTPYARSSN